MTISGNPLLLLVDDEKPIRQSIRYYLEDYNYRIVEAENGRIGLQKFREINPDLVLVDLRMPEVDGIEVLKVVTRESPHTPILVMSGTGVIGDAVEALRLGAWDYLFKPFEDLTVLNHAIEKALERTRLLRENMAYHEQLELQVTQRTEELEYAAREWRKSEEKYRLLVENQQDMIIKFDTQGRLLFVSPSYCRSFGKTQDELLGRPFMPLVHPEDHAKIMQAIEDVYKPPFSTYVEARSMTQEGWRWQAWLNSAVLNQAQEVIAVVAVGRDITSRKQAETERERLEMAVEQASEIIFITDTAGIINYANPAFYKVTGYCKEETIGQTPRILKSGKQDSHFYQDLWNTIINGKIWTGRVINRKKDGCLYTEDATITPIRSASGDIVSFVAVKRDITEELKLQAQLHLAQKMEAIASLTGGIAHDFNNLLTVINGHAEIALVKIQKGQSVLRDVQAIIQAGQRAENLTRQLLAFSRKQNYTPKVIDMNLVINQMEKILLRLISEEIHLEIRFAPDIPPIKADPSQIEQILMNLVVNARDAIQEKTSSDNPKRIIIETARVYLDENFVAEHPGGRTGLHVALIVTDTGIGMDEETKEKIFEPFFTTKEKGKGTGLGMSTVYGIVKQNNGNIFVYSEPNMGTTFKIYWPSTEEQQAADIIVEPTKSSATGHETILLVEDDEAVRVFAQEALKELGYRVFEAANGKIAYHMIEENQFTPDLLLTDLVMPEMNGKELSEKLRAQMPQLKILLASGYTDNRILKRDELGVGVYYIQKPYSFQALASKVREILDQTIQETTYELTDK